jgi:hypothetical protein
MAMKQPGRKVYKSANGKNVDLDLLISRNELTPAVGNAKVNARGDELGPGGKIVRKKEDILKDYYNNSAGLKSETVVKNDKKIDIRGTTGVSADEIDDWEETDGGDFIKKGK